MGFFDRIKKAVVRTANATMNREAQIILAELKAECPRSKGGHNGKHIADSFKILSTESEGTVAGTFETSGLIKKVVIGSTELGAYYAVHGNGGPGRRIYPSEAKTLKLESLGPGRNGKYKRAKQVHGYDGHNFIKDVADRHR